MPAHQCVPSSLNVLQVESLVQQQPPEAASTASCQTAQHGAEVVGQLQAAAADDTALHGPLEPLFDAALKVTAGASLLASTLQCRQAPKHGACGRCRQLPSVA